MKLDEILAGSLSEEELLNKMITDLRTLKAGIAGLQQFDADAEVICIEIKAMIGMLTESYSRLLEKKERLRKANEELGN